MKIKNYEAPNGLTEEYYYKIMCDFITLAEIKGLTIRQAQKLFTDCSDAILDTDLNKSYYDDRYLKSISDSLNKIAYKGVDIFKRSSSTNN